MMKKMIMKMMIERNVKEFMIKNTVDFNRYPKIELIAHTKDVEKIITVAGKLCYSKTSPIGILENLKDDEIKEYINMIMGLGHGSILEHANFTFAIENLSRVTEIQLLRKRTASPSVQSGRYVFREKAKYYIPKEIEKNKLAKEEYMNSVTSSQESYLKIVDTLEKGGLNLKTAIENARYVQPQSVCTNMLFTIDLRNLIDLISLRKCKRAQEEIRDLIYLIEIELENILPNIFKFIGAPCELGGCKEGKMCCKNPYKKKVK